jgi:cysteine desulfurase
MKGKSKEKKKISKTPGKNSIYLDFASATPIDKKVLEVYVQTAQTLTANPSALHSEGRRAKLALEHARQQVANTLEVHSDEIIFTSGGTEGDNIAILGVLKSPKLKEKLGGKKPHLIISTIEHAAIIESAEALLNEGLISLSYAPVTKEGIVDITEFKKLLRPETVLVSIMYANNEIGTVQPIREIAKVIRHFRKIQNSKLKAVSFPLFHTDATQAANYLSLRVPTLGVDVLTLNGSKIYGPRGTGALYVRRGIMLAPILYGGEQEGNRRPGTEHVPGAVAFAEALVQTQKVSLKEATRLAHIQKFFFSELFKVFPDIEINGSQKERLPNNVHVTFPGFQSEILMLYLDAKGIFVSEKSACKSESAEPSHVIAALGKISRSTDGSIRFSLGRTTTKDDIRSTVNALQEIRTILSTNR